MKMSDSSNTKSLLGLRVQMENVFKAVNSKAVEPQSDIFLR